MKSSLARFVTSARPVGILLRPGARWCCRPHLDAIHRTWRHAEFTAGAVLGDDGVHLFESPNNGVDWAGFDAQGAADAEVLKNHRKLQWRFLAMFGIERNDGAAGDAGQALDAFVATWRTLVDLGLALRDRLSVGLACRVATTRALRLRQHRINGGG